ncbi:MAG: M12 family metallo-peptidase [Bifidobacteriaceae bacterium]|nr:M12 family metallo-peptidase [Bifidobacteriaceae bacterium]
MAGTVEVVAADTGSSQRQAPDTESVSIHTDDGTDIPVTDRKAAATLSPGVHAKATVVVPQAVARRLDAVERQAVGRWASAASDGTASVPADSGIGQALLDRTLAGDSPVRLKDIQAQSAAADLPAPGDGAFNHTFDLIVMGLNQAELDPSVVSDSEIYSMIDQTQAFYRTETGHPEFTINYDKSTPIKRVINENACSSDGSTSWTVWDAAGAALGNTTSSPSNWYRVNSEHRHLLVIYPDDSTCDENTGSSVVGRGSIGSSGLAGGGDMSVWADVSKSPAYWATTLAHELGHNFGLNHSRAQTCQNASSDRTDWSDNNKSDCGTIEYGDVSDVMGSAMLNKHISAARKIQLGLLTPGSKEVALDGTVQPTEYNLSDTSTNPNTLQAIAINDPDSTDTIVVEYRKGWIFGTGIAIMRLDENYYTTLIQWGLFSVYYPEAGIPMVTGDHYETSGGYVDVDVVSTGGDVATVRVSRKPAPATLNVTPGAVSVDYRGDLKSFAVTTNQDEYTATTTDQSVVTINGDKASITHSSGQALAARVNYNKTHVARTATISITAGDKTIAIDVTQGAEPAPDIALDATSITFPHEGGVIVVSYCSNVSIEKWQISNWLTMGTTLVTMAGWTGMTITAPANTSASARYGVVNVVAEDGATATVNVSQVGDSSDSSPQLVVSPAAVSVGGAGGMVPIRVTGTGGLTWAASTGDSWLDVAPGVGNEGDTVVVRAQANPDTDAQRVGSVSIKAGATSVSVKITEDTGTPAPAVTVTKTITAEPSVTPTVTHTETTTVPVPGPTVVTTVPGPTVRTTVPGPTVVTTVPGPTVVTTVPGPVVRTTVPGPTVVTTVPGPTVVTTVPGPIVRTTVPGPTVTTTVPGPVVRTTVPGPTVVTTVPGPTIRTTVPGPTEVTTVPGPTVVTTVPGPTVRTTVPGPTVRTTVPGPVVRTTVPGPTVVTTVPGPTVTTTVPGPVITTTVTTTAAAPAAPIATIPVATGPAGGPALLPQLIGTNGITGTLAAGSAVAAPAVTLVAGVRVTYQWYRGATPVAGANRATYKLRKTDVGKRLRVEIRATGLGESEVLTSATTAKVAKTAAPIIQGKVSVGAGLTVKPGTWTRHTKFVFRWYRDGRLVKAGRAATRYVLTKADQGHHIRVAVTGTRPGYATVVRKATTRKVGR